MPSGAAGVDRSGLAARVRAWWDASTFLGDVALLFTVVTVGNSIMMLTGLDEPKDGSFAYVHLLGRLGIITVVVGLFYLDEFRDRFTRRRQRERHRDAAEDRPGAGGAGREAVLDFTLHGVLDGTARVFTTLVAATCLLVLAFVGVRPPAGGSGLYRNLVVLALALLPVMFVASRWWRHRTAAGRSRPA